MSNTEANQLQEQTDAKRIDDLTELSKISHDAHAARFEYLSNIGPRVSANEDIISLFGFALSAYGLWKFSWWVMRQISRTRMSRKG